jgi:phage baseplate assembly protein W
MPTDIIGRGIAFPPRIGPHGVLALVGEEKELEQSIEIILRTVPGQRVMRPDFGCYLQELTFAPNNTQTASQAERYVQEALDMWEPRIQLNSVRARRDGDGGERLLIHIDYEVKTTHDRRSLVYPFYIIPGEAEA